MSVSVRIPTILRTYTGGESEVSANGDTVAAVLDDLDSNYSGIKGRIVDEQGELRRFVNVYVGNDDVRFLENLETATPKAPRSRSSRRSRAADGRSRAGARLGRGARLGACSTIWPRPGDGSWSPRPG
jgi:molybdopterin converting factor small subunit